MDVIIIVFVGVMCAMGLVIGFGIVAEITIFIACAFGGIVTIICTIAIAVEAFIVMKIYNKNEIKMLKKR